MASLEMVIDCPIEGCDGRLTVPASSMRAKWPTNGRAEVELHPDEEALKAILTGHFLEQHADALTPDFKAGLQAGQDVIDELHLDSDLNQAVGGSDG